MVRGRPHATTRRRASGVQPRPAAAGDGRPRPDNGGASRVAPSTTPHRPAGLQGHRRQPPDVGRHVVVRLGQEHRVRSHGFQEAEAGPHAASLSAFRPARPAAVQATSVAHLGPQGPVVVAATIQDAGDGGGVEATAEPPWSEGGRFRDRARSWTPRTRGAVVPRPRAAAKGLASLRRSRTAGALVPPLAPGGSPALAPRPRAS